MSETPTPGAMAYAAYWQTHYALRYPTHSQALVGWTKLAPTTRQCITQAWADYQIAAMEAVLRTLEGLGEREQEESLHE